MHFTEITTQIEIDIIDLIVIIQNLDPDPDLNLEIFTQKVDHEVNHNIATEVEIKEIDPSQTIEKTDTDHVPEVEVEVKQCTQ